jgi:drug/metabolite transporter (DMT)-like permease
MKSQQNPSPAFGWSDLFMLGVIVTWGLNFSVIKIALREMSPAGFNGVRLVLTAVVFLVILAFSGEGFRLGKGDLWKLALIGMAGNGFYQVLFINGLSLTTASNTSFILAISPALVAVLGVLFRIEKIHWAAWLGIFVSLAGLTLVIGNSGGSLRFSGEGFRGDLMIFCGTILWSLYTVFSKNFLDRISPLKFAAVTVFFGALTYLPFSARAIVRIPWSRVSAASWAGLAFSSVFSLVLGYLVWYTSVKRVGNARTAVYSNLTPLFTALFAYLFLGESLGLRKIIGGIVILAGVYLARSGYYYFIKCRPDVG